MDPSKSFKQIYSALCLSAWLHISEKEPWHTSMVMSLAELSLLYATKRGGPKQGQEGGCDWAALVSFEGQIDREAATRMSGRHQTISLRNLIN